MRPCPSGLQGPLPDPHAWPAGAPCRLEAQTPRDATSQGPRQVTLCARPPAAPTKHKHRCLGPEAAPSRPTDHGHAGGGRPAPTLPAVHVRLAPGTQHLAGRGGCPLGEVGRAGSQHLCEAFLKRHSPHFWEHPAPGAPRDTRSKPKPAAGSAAEGKEPPWPRCAPCPHHPAARGEGSPGRHRGPGRSQTRTQEGSGHWRDTAALQPGPRPRPPPRRSLLQPRASAQRSGQRHHLWLLLLKPDARTVETTRKVPGFSATKRHEHRGTSQTHTLTHVCRHT